MKKMIKKVLKFAMKRISSKNQMKLIEICIKSNFPRRGVGFKNILGRKGGHPLELCRGTNSLNYEKWRGTFLVIPIYLK